MEIRDKRIGKTIRRAAAAALCAALAWSVCVPVFAESSANTENAVVTIAPAGALKTEKIKYEDLAEKVSLGNTAIRALHKGERAMKDEEPDEFFASLAFNHQLSRTEIENSKTEAQIVKGAQTAYITALRLGNDLDVFKRAEAAADRKLRAAEIMAKYGFASPGELEEIKLAKAALEAQEKVISDGIEAAEQQLAVMCGYKANYRLVPDSVPSVSAEQLKELDLSSNLNKAVDANYDVQLAGEDRYYQNNYGTKYGGEAADYAEVSAKGSAETSVRQAYRKVSEAKLAAENAEAAYAQEQKNYAAAEVKYKHGRISANALTDAEDALKDRESALAAARLDLFDAWNSYQWAVNGLI